MTETPRVDEELRRLEHLRTAAAAAPGDRGPEEAVLQQIVVILEAFRASDPDPSPAALERMAQLVQTQVASVAQWFSKRGAARTTSKAVQRGTTSYICLQSLQIGAWETTSRYIGDTVMEIDRGNQTVSWVRLDQGVQQRIAFTFEQITALMVAPASSKNAALVLRLSAPPLILEEKAPAPDRATWAIAPDFTGNQYRMDLVHRAITESQLMDTVLAQLVKIPHFQQLIQKTKSADQFRTLA